MIDFAGLLVQADLRESGFALEIPPEWHQGRTAYGGLSAALALAAARRVSGTAAPLRSSDRSMGRSRQERGCCAAARTRPGLRLI
jgi:hypothetical protein